jgi:hypothetical protein
MSSFSTPSLAKNVVFAAQDLMEINIRSNTIRILDAFTGFPSFLHINIGRLPPFL